MSIPADSPSHDRAAKRQEMSSVLDACGECGAAANWSAGTKSRQACTGMQVWAPCSHVVQGQIGVSTQSR